MIICGDTHIGAIFGLGKPNGKGGNTRVDDYEASLNYIVDYAIETKADIFIQTGDVFEHREPAAEHLSVMDRALKKLSSAGISTFVIMGNHDYKRNGETFTSSIMNLLNSDLPNVRILLNPEVIEVCNFQNEKVNLLLVPFRDRRMYDGKTNREQSEGFNGEIRRYIQSINNNDPVVAVGHNFFFEGNYTDYGGTEILADQEAFQGCDLVAMGHLHQFRVLRKRTPVCVYTGSMERTNFGDKNVDKYFIDYDSTLKKIKFCKTPTRDMIDDTIDLSEVNFSSIETEIVSKLSESQLKDKIVRYKFVIDEKVLPVVDKSFIQNKIYDLGAHFVSKINIEAVTKRLVRNSTILEHKDDIAMIEAYLDSQEMEDVARQKLLKEAKIIMGVA